MHSDSFEDLCFPPLPGGGEVSNHISVSHVPQHHFVLPQHALATDIIHPSQYQTPSTFERLFSYQNSRGRWQLHIDEEAQPISSHEWPFVDPAQVDFQNTKSNKDLDLSQRRNPVVAPSAATLNFNPDGAFGDQNFDLIDWDSILEVRPQLGNQVHAIPPVNLVTNHGMLRNDEFEFWPPRTEPSTPALPQPSPVEKPQTRPFSMSTIHFFDPTNGSSIQYDVTNLTPSSHQPPSQLNSIETGLPPEGRMPLGPSSPLTSASPNAAVKKKKGNNPHGCKGNLRCENYRKTHSKVRR